MLSSSRRGNLMQLHALLVAFVLAVGFTLPVGGQVTPVNPGRTVPDRIVVVFRSATLPSDADDRVRKAGGRIVDNLAPVGVLIVAPASVNGATLVARLRADAAILNADYDLIVDLLRPAAIAEDEGATLSPATDLAHPLPTFSPALPADFFYTSSPQQWAVKRVGAQGGGVPGGGPGAWDLTKGLGTKIAILDTGVNSLHPDVSENLIFNRALTFDLPAFGTPNCEVPDAMNVPFDLPADQNGHGTFTSSLAAGAVGGGLMIGVAPEAHILNIKVLRNRPATPAELQAIGVPDTPYNRCLFRDGVGLFSWILQGMLLANQQGADVISMSIAGVGFPRNIPGGVGGASWSAFNRVANFVTANGSFIVAAAGNEATDLSRIGPLVALPGQASNVVPIVATTNPALLPPTPPARQPCSPGDDCLAYYSDFGPNLQAFAAPGGDLPVGGCAFSGSPCLPTGFVRAACSAGLPGTVSPVPAGYPALGPPPAGTSWGCFSFSGAAQHAWYIQSVGTSASTPLVAGVAALVKAMDPSLTPSQIRAILQQTAEDIGRVGYDPLFNFGLVNARAAVRAVQ
jgi:lantibiotic leader peptide-processing serine protease